MLSINKICNRVYKWEFDNHYDMTMCFLRVADYIESPTFQGKTTEIVDLIDHYYHKIGDNNFSYPNDWCGYNVDAKDLKNLYEENTLYE